MIIAVVFLGTHGCNKVQAYSDGGVCPGTLVDSSPSVAPGGTDLLTLQEPSGTTFTNLMWSANSGTVVSTGSNTATWTAPNQTGLFTVTLTFTATTGSTSLACTATLPLAVNPVDSGVSVDSGAEDAGSCACDAGCCDTSGACQPGTSTAACGETGQACTACALGYSCLSNPRGGLCAFLPPDAGSDGGCTAMNCSYGCCQGGFCQSGTSQTACGSKGATCTACSNGQTCQPIPPGGYGGACAIPPDGGIVGNPCGLSCMGCCGGTLTPQCLPGTTSQYCGIHDNHCISCAPGTSCIDGGCY